MRISRDRFSELVSLYLDGEASEEELALLAKCVRSNRSMRTEFINFCRIHEATCAFYGTRAEFGNAHGLDSILREGKGESNLKAAFEWSGIGAFAVLAFVLSPIGWIFEKSKLEEPASSNSEAGNICVEFASKNENEHSGDVFMAFKIIHSAGSRENGR